MKTNIILPQIDVNEDKVSLHNFRFSNGDMVKKGDLLLVAETIKSTMDIISNTDGFIAYSFNEGDCVPSGSIICSIFNEYSEYKVYLLGKEDHNNIHSQRTQPLATAKAIKKAREFDIDLAKIEKDGIIKESDVSQYCEQHKLIEHEKYNTVKHVFKFDNERVVIIGAGKGAEVVIDILLDDHQKVIVGLVDDNVKSLNHYDYKISPYGLFEFADKADRNMFDSVVISIGANLKSMELRAKIFNYYREREFNFTNVISKNIDIRRNVKIGEGNLIGARVYIGTMTTIGDNNSISYGATIGHHNSIGSHNLIAPNVVTSGSVKIGNQCIIPAGVNVINRVSIGDNVVFPLGYNVVQNIEDGITIKDEYKNMLK